MGGGSTQKYPESAMYRWCQRSGFRVHGQDVQPPDSGLRVEALSAFRVEGSGFMSVVWGLGFRIWGIEDCRP